MSDRPDEPDHELGYWERKAAEGGPTPSEGIVFNPQTAVPLDGSTISPVGTQPAQKQWAAPTSTPYDGPPVEYPRALLAVALGIVAVPGFIVTCGLSLLVAPFAMVIGHQARRAIDAHPGRWSGRDRAVAGFALGLIGTVLLTPIVIGAATLLFVLLQDPHAFDP